MKFNQQLNLFWLWFILLQGFSISNSNAQDNYISKRKQMVEFQLKDRGIKDEKVLLALQKVQRHLFVPKQLVHEAYSDTPLRIGFGQTISQPYIVAYMTEILQLKSTDKVLEVGTGSGYQAAILAELCDSVFTIEVIPQLGDQASVLLDNLGYHTVKVKIGDGYKGWSDHAPFDAIIVTCSPTHIPQALKTQLAEGGKMIIPVGEQYAQKLIFMEKTNGKIKKKNVLPVRFVPMINQKGSKY